MLESRKYYLRGIVLPAVIIVLVYFISYIIHVNTPDPGYESEYFGEDSIAGIQFVFVLIHTILVLFLSSTILLVEMSTKTKFVRFLWWFLPAGSWLFYLLFKEIRHSIHYPDSDETSFYTLTNTIPYLVGLIWGYLRYNRRLAAYQGELEEIEIITKEQRKIQQPHTPPPARTGH